MKITKASGNTSITDNNACYSLAGATYGVYNTAADASAGTNAVTTLTTDDTGATGVSDGLVPGTYYVKETVAPQGYILDTTGGTNSDGVYAVPVTAGQTATFNATDQPGADPTYAFVYKIDSETGKQTAQGSASLAGAQFTVQYYDGQYATAADAQASGAAMKTWVYQTESNGAFVLNDSADYISGDALYYDSFGNVTLPLGTYVYTETKASPGYLLPDNPSVFVTQVSYNPASSYGYTITGDQPGSSVGNYGDSTTVQKEQVIRGDVEIAKVNDAETTSTVEPPLGGIQFTLTEQTSGDVYTITTNDQGFATTKSLIPVGSDESGALPFGTYLIHEVASTIPAGLTAVPDFTSTISKDGQLNQYILNDADIMAAIKVEKVDSTTGKAITASGMTFEILDQAGNVMSFTQHSPEVKTVTQFTTDANGVFTLPQQLPWGTYYVHELTAPIGYNKMPDQIFSVTTDAPFSAPLVVECANQPQMAVVSLTKLDKVSQEPMGGATYGLYAAQDIVTGDGTTRNLKGDLVATIAVTGPTVATSAPVFVGQYTLQEISAPVGYLEDMNTYPVDLSYNSAVTEVDVAKTVEDDYTKLQISKTDMVTGAEVPGAELALTSDLTGSIVATWTSGTSPYEIDKLVPGGYTLTETQAPDGYLKAQDVQFSVNATGDIQKVEMKDDYTKVQITKTDLVTGKDLPGAELELTDSTGSIVATWTSGTSPKEIDHLAPGAYTLIETGAPEGYLTAENVPVIVLPNGDIQKFVMQDDYTKLSVNKTDLMSGLECPGASLEILTSDESSVVASWQTTDTANEIDHLTPGAYILRETAAPDGYLLANDVPFSIDATGAMQMIGMQDDYTKVQISKVDMTTGKEIAGAKLVVKDTNGTVIDQWTSTTTPHEIDKLSPGVYTLTEITAPNGYEVAKTITFTVQETGEIQKVVMKDAPVPLALPKTGDNTKFYVLGFIVLALIAIGAVIAMSVRNTKGEVTELESEEKKAKNSKLSDGSSDKK